MLAEQNSATSVARPKSNNAPPTLPKPRSTSGHSVGFAPTPPPLPGLMSEEPDEGMQWIFEIMRSVELKTLLVDISIKPPPPPVPSRASGSVSKTPQRTSGQKQGENELL